MVPHSMPIESVEGEWSELHRLAIGVRGSKAGEERRKTTVVEAEARAGGVCTRGEVLMGEEIKEAAQVIAAAAVASLLFATRRCNPDTLVSLQEDFLPGDLLRCWQVVLLEFHWE
ncbi:unnamed protein product [Closterium sp. NIES-64]|nr:unnamed protein product [Closterium sp. NIES-64]